MRGIAFPLVALAFIATTPDPVAAQCYGPECGYRQSNGPATYNERPNFHSYPSNGQQYRSVPYEQAQPYRQAPYQGQQYRPAPHEQAQPYRQPPYQGQPYQSAPYEQAQPYRQAPYQMQPQHSAPYHQGQPYQPMPQSQPAYQRPAYQTQPRPPMGYSNVPPGMAPGMAPRMAPGASPRGPNYHPAYSDGRMETRTRVTKISKPARPAIRQQQPALDNRTVVRSASRPAGAGQVTISVAEYRDLQNQARELQRLRGAGAGVPLGAKPSVPNEPSPFPQVPPPAGNTPAL